jgi:hypothetical protein
MATQKGSAQSSKKPFVEATDRPEVKLSLDKPVTELRVRDLAAILGHLTQKSPFFEVGQTPIKDFFDKPFPEVVKDYVKEVKPEKFEKPEKPEKVEKNEKHEKPEKLEKAEKLEKPEFKELKLEKIENDGVFDPVSRFPPGPDPRLAQVIQALAGLTQQVSVLADQVAELQKRTKG